MEYIERKRERKRKLNRGGVLVQPECEVEVNKCLPATNVNTPFLPHIGINIAYH